MKQTKKTRKVPNGRLKDSRNNWKKKAVLRRLENEQLKKQLKERTVSRDKWKTKYQELKKTGLVSNVFDGEKARKHQYSLALMVMVLELYKYGGMSLRSCRHSLICMFVCLNLSIRVPSHNTIRNWLCKGGIYRVKMRQSSSASYVLIVDESITFGSEKILLILGVKSDKIDEKKALSHNDMEVLYVGASKEWKGEQIKTELEQIAKQETIKYVVSDKGTNLRKAYNLLNYSHIEDCTHVFANDLKRIYGKDADFEAFRKLIGKLRRDWNLSKEKSKYMPPTMRGKMRFANIFPCVIWAQYILANWSNLSEEIQASLIFLKEKSAFIQSLIEVEKIFKFVCSKLKTNGFSKEEKQEILCVLSAMEVGKIGAIFIKNCEDYLENLSKKRKLLAQDNLLCSSDIIESYFGKFKTKINPNSRSGLTEFIFTIATFGRSFSQQEVKQAMQNIKCKDLKLYRNTARAA